MVRNNSSGEAKNSLLQLSNWGQVSNNDREAIDGGADGTAADESSHAAAQSIITQVSKPAMERCGFCPHQECRTVSLRDDCRAHHHICSHHVNAAPSHETCLSAYRSTVVVISQQCPQSTARTMLQTHPPPGRTACGPSSAALHPMQTSSTTEAAKQRQQSSDRRSRPRHQHTAASLS